MVAIICGNITKERARKLKFLAKFTMANAATLANTMLSNAIDRNWQWYRKNLRESEQLRKDYTR